ncbi:Sugar kinase of the NBD/HSP70 family, may contain an N-terminal HTH domain [Halolactibacillus halophilus]|uniref:Sugar kinase n=1 Tax=Halolactibacillus halophilus TaxID=306540 RepID=A0A1I5QND0_9BACI|nr:ROK family protein [Halolactibacillus halophilus]GEM01865.1 sugar kinase [Halolactibacillus halophilus]SFP47774.1 Sugar kinase of the NBD/HSP70 family, may contain an N-terminal HTH domain [Halolactibacillus halophilus]
MYMVYDIGGTFVKYAYVDRTGEAVNSGKFETPYVDAETLIKQIVAVAKTYTGVQGLAISCPGTIDVQTGVVYHGGALKYLHEVNMKQRLSEALHLPVSIENDAKCAALAELWKGSVKNHLNSVVLVIGTGVGGAIIINGALYRGAHLEAGEQSYVMDRYDVQTNKATFVGETCSASLTVKEIAETVGLEAHDGEGVFRYLNAGHREALQIFDRFCHHLAAQIINLQYVVDPEIFAIGGGISVQPLFIERLRKAIAEILTQNPHHVAKPKLTTCHFRSQANVYGALYQHLLEYQS